MRVDGASRFGGALLGALLAGAAWAAAASSLAALDMPNLSGKWYLNKDASDSPASASGESGGGSGSGYHGGGGGGGHHGGRHGRSSQPSDDGSRTTDDGSSMQEVAMRVQVLEIKHDEPKLSITDASGRERVLYTDGRKVEEEHSYGGTTKVSARWKDGRIEVVSSPEKGPKITETYAVTADHSQLTVTTTFSGGRRDVTVRRVYQTSPPASSAPPAAQPPPPSGNSQPDPDPAEDSVV